MSTHFFISFSSPESSFYLRTRGYIYIYIYIVEAGYSTSSIGKTNSDMENSNTNSNGQMKPSIKSADMKEVGNACTKF